MRYWLGVVQRSHVLHGVALGIAQTNHGVRSGIQRMQPGDGLVYYSPKTDYPDGDPLREFTAIGRIADGEAWQADDTMMVAGKETDRHPWRRRVEYDERAHAVPDHAAARGARRHARQPQLGLRDAPRTGRVDAA